MKQHYSYRCVFKQLKVNMKRQTQQTRESTNRTRETREIQLEAPKSWELNTFKNIFLSGFLHRHELSFNLRGRRGTVTSWPQSRVVIAADWRRGLAPLSSKAGDGKANRPRLSWTQRRPNALVDKNDNGNSAPQVLEFLAKKMQIQGVSVPGHVN